MPTSSAIAVRLVRAHGDAVFACLLAVLWLTGVITEGIPGGTGQRVLFVVTGLLLTVPFAWRRRAPVTTALVIFAAGTVLALLQTRDLPVGFIVVALVAGYSLGAHAEGWRSVAAISLSLAALAVGNVRHNDAGAAGLVLTPAVFVLAPWAVGGLVARLRRERGELHRMAVQLERSRRTAAARARRAAPDGGAARARAAGPRSGVRARGAIADRA